MRRHGGKYENLLISLRIVRSARRRANVQLELRRMEHRIRDRLRIFRAGDGDAEHLQHYPDADPAAPAASDDDQAIRSRRGRKS